MKKSRLKAYSLLATGVAVAGSANAQIIYQDINPDEIVDTATSYMLDIDNDGIDDFMFAGDASSNSAFQFYASGIFVMPLGDNHVSASASSSSSTYLIANVANLNDTIGTFANNPSSASSEILIAGHASLGSSTFPSGNWSNVDNKYLGFKLEKNGAYYYGWLRASVSDTNGLEMVIKDYAYQTVANTPIIAGETGVYINENQLEKNTNIFYQNASVIIKSNKNVDIKIYNIDGRLINDINQVNNYKIDENYYTKGVYIIKINDEKEEMTKKVIL